MGYGSRLQFITENPVTTAYDARQQAEQEAQDASLRNTMNRATLLRTVAMAPVELQGAQEDLRGKKQGNDFDASANPVKLDSMKSQADLNKTQAYVAGQTAGSDISRAQAQAQEAGANAQVAVGTVGSRVANSANQAQGSYLQNLRTTGQIADDKTQRQQSETKFAQDQLGAKTQAEENVFLRAIRDPEAAIAEGKAAGVVTTPQQEAILRNPVLTNAAAALISQLRAQSNDPAWRDAEFQKLFPQIASQPGGAVQGALEQALATAKTDAPGAGAKSDKIVTLYDPGGKPKSFRENDPNIDQMLKDGWTTAAPKSGSVLTQVGTNADGTPVFDYVATAPKMTEDQSKAMQFASRMEASSPIIDKFEKQGTDLMARAKEKGIPFDLGNYMQSAEYQQYRQAKEDFLRAVLRKESGAVISEEEMIGADKQYFPVPGDEAHPEILAQKRQNRRVALEGMKSAAGPGATLIPGIIDRATGNPAPQVQPAPTSQSQPAQTAPVANPADMSDDDLLKALQQ